MERVVCFGPGPGFKGGIAHFNTSLAKALAQYGNCEVHMVSWSQQYPSVIPREFKDKQSAQDLLKDTGIEVYYVMNYNNPLTWHKTLSLIRSLKPDKVIFQWAITIQGIPIGWLAKKLMQWGKTEVIFDLHNIVQKENSSLDKWLTKTGIQHAHRYIVHGDLTLRELKLFFPEKFGSLSDKSDSDQKRPQIISLFHPVYDMFRPDPALDIDQLKSEWGLNRHVFLFFGFIRKYKGLHHAIAAFKKVLEKRQDVSLLIAGESFWNTLDESKWSTRLKRMVFNTLKRVALKKQDDEQNYHPLDLISEFGMEDKVIQHIDFIPNEAVHRYFQVSDALLLFYTYATPSGVESIAWNFSLPILATRVGNFPDTISEGFNGYLAEPEDIESMAAVMLKSIEQPINRQNVAEAAKNMSWERYVKGVLKT